MILLNYLSYADLINYIRLKKNKTYICKPDSGCQGRGIFITKNPNKDIKPGDNYVAQVYVSRVSFLDYSSLYSCLNLKKNILNSLSLSLL